MNLVKVYAHTWLKENQYEDRLDIQQAILDFAHEIDQMLEEQEDDETN